MDINLVSILLSLLLTSICYMIVPVSCRLFIGVYDNKEARKLSIINSVVVGLIFAILTIEFSDNNWNATPAILYYFINKFVLKIGNKKENIKHLDETIEFEQIDVDECDSIVEKEIQSIDVPSKEKVANKKIKVRYCKFCGGRIDDSKICTKCYKQYFSFKNFIINLDAIRVILSVLLIIAVVLNIYQYIIINKKNETIDSYRDRNVELREELRDKKDENFELISENIDLSEKANFLDENIVFVLEGYGKYYYTYDCVQEITDGEYTYWAYNKEAAKSKGYKKGNC